MFSEIWNNTFALTYQGILCIHKIVCEKIDNFKVRMNTKICKLDTNKIIPKMFLTFSGIF